MQNEKKSTKSEKKQGKSFTQRYPILANLLLMVAISIVIVFALMLIFNRYTRHGDSVVIPTVKGKMLSEVASTLEHANLTYEVVDSLYSMNQTHGTVLDIVPNEGAKVKPHRTVYLTVVALNKPQQVIPELSNMSMRQAKATLEGLGFVQISVRYIPGEFDNLTRAVHGADGKELPAGTRVNIDTPLTLVVTSNNIDMPDSLMIKEDWSNYMGSDSILMRRSDTVINKEKTPEKMEDNEAWW